MVPSNNERKLLANNQNLERAPLNDVSIFFKPLFPNLLQKILCFILGLVHLQINTVFYCLILWLLLSFFNKRYMILATAKVFVFHFVCDKANEFLKF